VLSGWLVAEREPSRAVPRFEVLDFAGTDGFALGVGDLAASQLG
jgi:hypothetical protein